MRRRSEVEEQASRVEFTIPVDATNEQVVLAAAIVGGDSVLDSLLRRFKPDQFFRLEHRVAWETLGELRRRKLSYDAATLQQIAGDSLRVAYLVELAELRPEVPQNLDFHLDALAWDRVRATVATGPLSSLLAAMKDPRSAPERVRALARHVSSSFEGFSTRGHVYDPRTLVADQMREIRQRIEGHASFPYGLHGLDYYEDGRRRMIPGTAPGLITLVTGVTGSGKSAFVAHLALGLAKQRRRVAFGAWEVQAPMALELLAVIDLGWSRSEMLDPASAPNQLGEDRLVVLEARMAAIAEWVTFVKNPFRRERGERRSNDANLDLVQGVLESTGCEVFVADLWARCLVSRRPDDEEEALFRQQAMLEEMGVHGIFAHQQRHKDIELRPDKRPTREGIKGSGAYLEAADTMIGIHRPAQWKNLTDDTMEALILKQRFKSDRIAVEFTWDGDRGAISGGRSFVYDHVPAGGGDLGDAFKVPRAYDPGSAPRGRRKG